MFRLKLILQIIAFFVIAPVVSVYAETLTLNQCVEIALDSQYDMRIARHNLNSYDLTFLKSSSVFYPQIEFSANYGYGTDEDNDPVNAYSAKLSAQQYIFDFGKSFRTADKARAVNVSYHASYESTRQGIIYNVINYYYLYLKAKHVEALNFENLETGKSHLEKAKGLFLAGTKSRIDVTEAEVSLADAELSCLKAQNSLKLAKLNLKNAFGYYSAADFEVEDNADTSLFEESLDSCVSIAAKSRPDIIQAKSSLESAKIDLNDAINFYDITLSAKGDVGYSGSGFPLGKTWSWGAYAVFSVPIFDGFSTQYDISSAKEKLKSVEVQGEKLNATLRYEVEQAYLLNKECYEAISVAKKGVDQARENLDLAEARYQNGVGSTIEFNDAAASMKKAQASYVEAIYDHAISIAGLKKAMGTLNE
jgi:outer membrane protein